MSETKGIIGEEEETIPPMPLFNPRLGENLTFHKPPLNIQSSPYIAASPPHQEPWLTNAKQITPVSSLHILPGIKGTTVDDEELPAIPGFNRQESATTKSFLEKPGDIVNLEIAEKNYPLLGAEKGDMISLYIDKSGERDIVVSPVRKLSDPGYVVTTEDDIGETRDVMGPHGMIFEFKKSPKPRRISMEQLEEDAERLKMKRLKRSREMEDIYEGSLKDDEKSEPEQFYRADPSMWHGEGEERKGEAAEAAATEAYYQLQALRTKEWRKRKMQQKKKNLSRTSKQGGKKKTKRRRKYSRKNNTRKKKGGANCLHKGGKIGGNKKTKKYKKKTRKRRKSRRRFT